MLWKDAEEGLEARPTTLLYQRGRPGVKEFPKPRLTAKSAALGKDRLGGPSPGGESALQ